MASHRLIGWIYFDPAAIENYTALGVDNGLGYYIASRGAPLAPAGHQAVAAAFYTIHPVFVEVCIGAAAAGTTFKAITDARNLAASEGLRRFVPEICDDLAELSGPLWQAVDAMSASGHVLFAAHRQWHRPSDPLVSAWLAINAVREFRGDTHFTLLAAEDLSATQAGLLHNAFLNYPDEWIPRSRGADDDAIAVALSDLESRGLAAAGIVNDEGLALRERIEARTNELTERAWRILGEEATLRFVELVEPVGQRLLDRIDETAGPDWMPAARTRRP